MNRSPPPRSRPAPGAREFAPALIAILVAALALFLYAPYAPQGSSGHWSSATRWSDPSVSAEFLPDHPAVTVGPTTSGEGYGLYAGLTSLEEVGPSGRAVALAVLGPRAWSFAPGASDGPLRAQYSAVAPVTDPSGRTIGSTELSVLFSAGPTSANATNDSVVAMMIGVTDWPWQASTDALALGLPLWPNDAALEHLSTGTGASGVLCLPDDGGPADEYLTWPAGSLTSSGAPGAGTVRSSYAGNGSDGVLTLTLLGVGGGSEVRFLPQIGIIPGPSAPVPWGAYVGVGALGAGLAAGVVMVLRRSWNAPPSLELAPPPSDPPGKGPSDP